MKKGRKRSGMAPITGGWAWLIGSGARRYARLAWSELRGWVEGMGRRPWWRLLWTVVGAAGLLALVPVVLNLFGSGNKVSDWVTPVKVAVVLALFWFARWLFRARERVVVEGFVDYTKEDATAVSGLSTLLVAELVRLRELYHQIDDISVPTAVGVERHGGFGRGKEAGVFLTVSADNQTNVLEGAIASDATVAVGPAKLPIGPIADMLNRFARGPRVVGSVHLTDASGGPTLTAQYLGRESSLTWRVDKEQPPESIAERKAFLDKMVRELACRMFTELTLHGSVRWKAVEAFNEYLRLYGDSRRTPRDRAGFLKQAQVKLLEAVAEDERFDLAFYNLGVIYTQLADTERLAEQEADDATSIANFDRFELEVARRAAARAAFERAAAKNPVRWEAYYAQAVIRFSEINPEIDVYTNLDPDSSNPDDKRRRDDLGAVIALCRQALRVSPGQQASVGAVYDLLGMAQTRLGDDFRAAMRSHRRAAHHAWIEYCEARRRDRALPAGRRTLAEHARANATAAIHSLALAYERRALMGKKEGSALLPPDPLDLYASQRIFRRAERLAGEASPVTGACRFERAGALEHAKRFRQAAAQFERAGAIHPRSPEYRARRAKALAKRSAQLRAQGRDRQADEVGEEAKAVAGRALELLARPFSVAVAPYATDALRLRCDGTIAALEAAYAALEDKKMEERMGRIGALKKRIETAGVEQNRVTKRLMKRRSAAKGAAELLKSPEYEAEPKEFSWELEQLYLAIGRLFAEGRKWPRARWAFETLVGKLSEEHRTDRLVEYGAYAHLARAQRETGNPLKALQTAAEEVRRDSLCVEARREAGRAHFALGQFTDALEAWKHALWLSPSDPYLHYEVAMCRRRIAREESDPQRHAEHAREARREFQEAQQFFDGEFLDGEAWTRLWLGKLALEGGDLVEALAQLQGAEHGTAKAAAALLLGETHLLRNERPAADHAFDRCQEALKHRQTSELAGRETVDALWGDELPRAAVEARIARGKAEAKFLSPGDWQKGAKLNQALKLLKTARADLDRVEDDSARDQARIRVLDTESVVRQAKGEIDRALDLVRERLRYECTDKVRDREDELLKLRDDSHKGKLDHADIAHLAAEQARERLKMQEPIRWWPTDGGVLG